MSTQLLETCRGFI